MAIGSVAAPAGAGASSSTLGLQDFMKVLLTQLTFQDPLKPMDNQAFMAQMAQFASLEQTQRLNVNLEQLLASQSALQSVGLLGRSVDVDTPSGAVSGTVASLSLKGQVPLLSIATTAGPVLSDVALSRVTAVR